jgi:hypothetical protein
MMRRNVTNIVNKKNLGFTVGLVFLTISCWKASERGPSGRTGKKKNKLLEGRIGGSVGGEALNF